MIVVTFTLDDGVMVINIVLVAIGWMCRGIRAAPRCCALPRRRTPPPRPPPHGLYLPRPPATRPAAHYPNVTPLGSPSQQSTTAFGSCPAVTVASSCCTPVTPAHATLMCYRCNNPRMPRTLHFAARLCHLDARFLR